MTLIRSGVIVAFFTLLSRFLGLFRELYVAFLFGTSNTGDCVNIAFKLPNLFRRIFGEGALSTVFVPIFSEKILNSELEAKKFISEVFTLLLFALIIITVLMQIFMPSLMFIIAPGFYQDLEKFTLTVQLTRITMPYLIFISVSALLGSILNSVKRFAAFAATPIIMSACVIIFTYFLDAQYPPPYAMSWSLIIAGILQTLFMFFCLYRAKLLFSISFKIVINTDIKKFLINLGPAILSSGVWQLNLFISQSIASFISGAVSILTYADRIYQFPLSMIGVSFATVLLPELSKVYKNNDQALARKIQTKAIKTSLLLSIPAAFGICLLSHPIVHIIYERGAFDANSSLETAKTIAIFAFGLPAFILTKILSTVFYANHDTKIPFKISVQVMLINIVSNIMLIVPFSYLGIALGSVIAAWYNVWILYYHAERNYQFSLEDGVRNFCFKTIICSIIMSIAVMLIYYNYHDYFYLKSGIVKIITLTVTITTGLIVFLTTSLYFKLHKILFS